MLGNPADDGMVSSQNLAGAKQWHTITAAGPAVGETATPSRRDRWRSGRDGSPRPVAGNRWLLRAVWTGLFATMIVAVWMLVILPFFAWQTVVVGLAIDDYDLAVVAPVPFAAADDQAFDAALAGMLSPAVNGRPLRLAEVTATAALESELEPLIAGLPLRPATPLAAGDVLIATIRGQTLIGPRDQSPAPTADPVAGKACLAASDLRLDGVKPRGLVPISRLVKACTASSAATTLITCDFGNLRWAPRLGVVGSFVPKVLDGEFAAEASKLPQGRRCWLLGSHAEGQLSGVDLSSGRSFFSRSLELGLSGGADEAPYGDDDGIVELAELFDFVRRWTAEWSRQKTGGSLIQVPVLWEVGVGRIAAADVPRDVQLLRLPISSGRPRPGPVENAAQAADTQSEPANTAAKTPDVTTAARPPTGRSAGQQVEAPANVKARGDKESPTEGTAVAEKEGNAETTPPAAGTAAVSPPPAISQPEPADGFWEWAERVATPTFGASPGNVNAPRPSDYAPHLWAEVLTVLAAADATVPDGSPRARRAEALRRDARRGWSLGSGQFFSEEPLLESVARRLNDASRRVDRAGFTASWERLPNLLRRSTQVFNDAVVLAQEVISLNGVVSGGLGPEPIDWELVRLVTAKSEEFVEAIKTIEAASAATTRGISALPATTTTAALERAGQIGHDLQVVAGQLREAGDQWINTLIADANETDSQRLHEIPWVLATRLPTAAHRHLLRTALEQAGGGGNLVPAGGRPSSNEPIITPLDGVRRRRLARAAQFFVRCHALAAAVHASGRDSVAAEAAAAWEAVDQATDEVAHDAITAAAGWGVELLGTIPIELLRLSRLAAITQGTDHPLRRDLLLRSLDPRDARRVPPAAFGHCVSWTSPRPIAFELQSKDRSLSLESPTAVLIEMLGSERLPPDSQFTPEFDENKLVVTDREGNSLRAGRPVPRDRLASGTRYELRVRAMDIAESAATAVAKLAVTITSDRRAASEEISFGMPSREELVFFIRGRGRTVDGSLDADRRLRVAVPAFPTTTATPAVQLRPYPGQDTAWECWLENRTGVGRRVQAELMAIGPVELSDRRPDLQGLATAAVNRTLSRTNRRDIARIDAIDLPASRRPIKMMFPDPPPQAEKTSGTEEQSDVEPLGSNLLLIIRDAEAAALAEEGTAAAAELLPVGRRRSWVVPIAVTAQTPKTYVAASGRWLPQGRAIAIELSAAGEDDERLPPAGARIRAGVFDAVGVSRPPLQLRKFETLLTARQPRNALTGLWNGANAGTAWLALEIDGFPRAHVLRIECGPATAGVEQRPQADLRTVAIVEPDVDFHAYRAPAEAVDLTVAADAPPDAFRQNADGTAAGRLELAIREKAATVGLNRGREQVVWSATADRETIFTAAACPDPSASLAIRTVARDWQVRLAQPGFIDVDLEIEARLFLPDELRPRTATRQVVLDGSPPRILVSPEVAVTLGDEATILVRAEDGAEAIPLVNGRRAGASGIARVEWGVTTDRSLLPEQWTPAPVADGRGFRIIVPTKGFTLKSRPIVAVRCFDRVGFESDVKFAELRLREPSKMAATDPANAPNDIRGKVLLNGKPQAGIRVIAVGPGSLPPQETGDDGSFQFEGVSPGEYRLSVPQATIRNRIYEAKPSPVTVIPGPAPPATVMLTLE